MVNLLYKKDYEIYSTALKNIQEPEVKKTYFDIEKYKKLLSGDFVDLYKKMSRNKKQTFWRTILREIKVDNNHKITEIYF